MSAHHAALHAELVRRVNQGWDLEGDIADSQMNMVHILQPPPWRILLEILNPLTWLGGPAIPLVRRHLHVWVDEAGVLHRRTTGAVPRGWRLDHSWEVPDGPEIR